MLYIYIYIYIYISDVLYSLTRATLMSPEKDETRACGYIYICIYTQGVQSKPIFKIFRQMPSSVYTSNKYLPFNNRDRKQKDCTETPLIVTVELRQIAHSMLYAERKV